MRELADLGLREADLVEGTAHAEFPRSLTARPVVAAVVGIVAIDNDGSAVTRDAREVRVELVLAVVAAIRGIRPVFRAFQFGRPDDFVPEAMA